MSVTEQYILVLTELRQGDLGLLRRLGQTSLDKSVDGFDLFAGLWWPLRQRNHRAPRREIAWLIAKLYAFCPIEHVKQAYFPEQMGIAKPSQPEALQNYQKRFDQILVSPIGHLEGPMQWGLTWLRRTGLKIDWVKLTDDLSIWELESTRLNWAKAYLNPNERNIK